MFEDDIQMLQLKMDKDERADYERDKITINKKMSRFFSIARKNAKQDSCYICKKSCSSFCNSHSVPKFCLKRIANDGKVYFSGIQLSLPLFGEDSGVKEAGTFQLICRDCDSKSFQDYENPLSYDKPLTGKILAQIAMKNQLQMISKRLYEKELYLLMREQLSGRREFSNNKLAVIDLDLAEFTSRYERAKIAASGHHNDWYYLCYYQKLNYVVPMSSQSIITMVCDFEGNLINDIYNSSSDYRTQDIHVAIFPLEKTSVVLMFIDSRDKRYRNFYRQLNKLPLDEQLATINYIVHSYTENVFLSKTIGGDVLRDESFLQVCQKSSIAVAEHPFVNALAKALDEFSLSRRNDIPNLLSPKYKLHVSNHK